MIRFEIGMDSKQDLLYAYPTPSIYSFVGVNFWTGITARPVPYRVERRRVIVLDYVPLWGRNS